MPIIKCVTGGHLEYVKPDASSIGSCVTEITVLSGMLALYPVDLTKK